MAQQRQLFKSNSRTSYGGELLKTRKGRQGARPLAVKSTMHLVLRSSVATGSWSFKKPGNAQKTKNILDRFSKKYGVTLLKRANVGNHIHLHIKLGHRLSYKPFIRAVTSAIAMAITGASRWRPLRTMIEGGFWDYRPFTRVVRGFRDFVGLQDYIELNQLEGSGLSRGQAGYILRNQWGGIQGSG